MALFPTPGSPYKTMIAPESRLPEPPLDGTDTDVVISSKGIKSSSRPKNLHPYTVLALRETEIGVQPAAVP